MWIAEAILTNLSRLIPEYSLRRSASIGHSDHFNMGFLRPVWGLGSYRPAFRPIPNWVFSPLANV